MTTTAYPFEDDDYPLAGRDADAVSARAHRRATRWLFFELLALIAIAFVGELLPELFHEKHRAVFGYTAAGLVVFTLAARRRRKGRARLWYEGRAVAESARTTAWSYMMLVPPIDERQVFARVREVLDIVSSGSRWHGALDRDEGITDGMRKVRLLPVGERAQTYLARRLNDQIRWYGDNAQDNARSAARFRAIFSVTQVLTVAAAVAVALGARSFVGVIATLAACVEAWEQYRRHDELQTAYEIARDELIAIRREAPAVLTQLELIDLVRGGEAAISREHTLWVANCDVRLAAKLGQAAPDDARATDGADPGSS